MSDATKLEKSEDYAPRFTIRPGRWYAWMMLPGYAGPYVSPIYVTRVLPEKTGKHWLSLGFYNAYYAAGVRDFSVRCRVLKRFPDHVHLDLTPGKPGAGRSAVISEISEGWLRLAGTADKYELDGSDVQDVLTKKHFRGRPPIG